MTGAAAARADWHYGTWRGFEQAVGRGRLGGLRMHFHAEHQITLVVAGSRRFATPTGIVAVGPGETVLLPAGLPHQALSVEEADAVSVNLYLPVSDGGAAAMPTDPMAIARLLSAADMPASLAAIAGALGIARETLGRRCRRLTGMTPSAFRLMGRLNRARALLRSGEQPAAAAAEAGFADQSHLGRHFRAAFGTTPAAYRRAIGRRVD